MRCRKRIAVIMLFLFLINLTGCAKKEAEWNPVIENRIKIAVIGDEEYIKDNGSMEAMELAADDFYEKTGLIIEIVIYDDEAEYNKAIVCAKEIAADQSIAAVIVKQELDYIDAAAEIFNEARLPFVLTNGCYERTIDQKYEYMLVDCLNAKIAGNLMAKYVIDKKYKKIAFCHSDTEYEEDELKGFQSEIEGSGVRLADTLVGPYTQEEFELAYQRWENLGVDAVCISNYDILNSDLIRMLRQKGSDIAVVGDYVMDTDEDIQKNGVYMENTAIIGMYIKNGEGNDPKITDRFEKKYRMEMSEKAIQSYDIISLLGEKLLKRANTSKEFVENIKAGDGYQGISGKVIFDENGCLIPNGSEILIFKDGVFH